MGITTKPTAGTTKKFHNLSHTIFTSGGSQSKLWLMNDPAKQREALEDLWRERTENAQRHYRIAKAECAKAISEQSGAAPPDGAFGYRKALRIENTALAEYKRVLTIFCDLTVNGKMPPPE